MTDRELMQQALYALEYASDMTKPENMSGCGCPICVTITALRERLAQPEQEPVAPKCQVIIEVFGKDWRLDYMSLPVGKHKLYTQQYTYIAPPQRKPLTDEEILSIAEESRKHVYPSTEFARAIEAAHGIKP